MVLLLLPSPTFKHFWWRLLKPFIFTSILPPICTYTSPSHILQPLPHHAIKFPHHFPLLHCHPVQSLSLRGLRWKISATRLWRSQTLDWLESGTAQPRWALPAPTPGWLLKSSAHLHSPRVATFGGGQGRVFFAGKKTKSIMLWNWSETVKTPRTRKKFSPGSSCHSDKAQTDTWEQEHYVEFYEKGIQMQCM